MIVNVIGIRRVTGKAESGSYDYFKVGYTYHFPRGTEGCEGSLGGTTSINSRFFPNRVPHCGDSLMIDFDQNNRVRDCCFLEDIL